MCKLFGHNYVIVFSKDSVSGFKIILTCTKCSDTIVVQKKLD